MTSAKEGGGGSRNAANLWTNSIDFVHKEEGEGKKYQIQWMSYMVAP